MTLDSLVKVTTPKGTYLGYAEEQASRITLTKAAILPDDIKRPDEVALYYYSEQCRRNLARYEIPLTAILEQMSDPLIDQLLMAYASLSKVANKGIGGRIKIARLKKMLGGRL